MVMLFSRIVVYQVVCAHEARMNVISFDIFTNMGGVALHIIGNENLPLKCNQWSHEKQTTSFPLMYWYGIL